MDNPKAAIDALLESTVEAGALKVHPLTVARYALLELVGSPLVAEAKQGPLSVVDVIPTVYIMTTEAKDLSKYSSSSVDKLKADAFEWAEDSLTSSSVPLVVNMLAQKLLDLRRIAPEAMADSKKKADVSPATAG